MIEMGFWIVFRCLASYSSVSLLIDLIAIKKRDYVVLYVLKKEYSSEWRDENLSLEIFHKEWKIRTKSCLAKHSNTLQYII